MSRRRIIGVRLNPREGLTTFGEFVNRRIPSAVPTTQDRARQIQHIREARQRDSRLLAAFRELDAMENQRTEVRDQRSEIGGQKVFRAIPDR
jgi:hypothetical protein